MVFDFDLKFAFTVSPLALDFEKQEEKVHYSLRSETDLLAVR
jgi:hypothetical protein